MILDLTILGGMGGLDASRNILAIDPSARLNVSSGYSSDEIMAEFKKYGFSSAIAKPYKAAELGELLRTLA